MDNDILKNLPFIPKEDYNNRYSDGYKEMGNEFYK